MSVGHMVKVGDHWSRCLVSIPRSFNCYKWSLMHRILFLQNFVLFTSWKLLEVSEGTVSKDSVQ